MAGNLIAAIGLAVIFASLLIVSASMLSSRISRDEEQREELYKLGHKNG